LCVVYHMFSTCSAHQQGRVATGRGMGYNSPTLQLQNEPKIMQNGKELTEIL
jgi:hypothetical protein